MAYNLNDPILLGTQVNGRWEIQEDTYKGNIPQGYQILTPQLAQQRIQENIQNQQGEINRLLAGGQQPDSRNIQGVKSDMATQQALLSKYSAAGYQVPQGTGLKYTMGPNGQLMTEANAANYISPEQGLKDSEAKAVAMGGLNPTDLYASNVKNQLAGGITAESVTPPNAVKLPSTISSTSLTGAAPVNYQTPTGNTSNVNAALAAANADAQKKAADQQAQQDATSKLGAKETELSQMLKDAIGGNDALAGRAAYQQQQNSAFGVTTAQQTKNSLEAKQRALLAKAAAIDLEVQQGQGVTTAIDQRQRAEAKRVIAIESLVNTALIAAADGDLANAKLQADEAVSLKYAPIEEAQKIKLANLELLSKDPNITVEQQKRAAAAAAIVKQQDAAFAQAKTDDAAKLKIATDVASGATAVQLQAIMAATSPAQALQIAASAGLLAETPDAYISTNDAGTVTGIDKNTGKVLWTVRGVGNAENSSGSDTKPTSDVSTSLISAGFTTDQIKHLDAGIKANGFQSVYDAEKAGGATDAQLKSLQDAYKVQPVQTKADVETDMRSLFTTTELKKMANELGYSSMWSSADTDIKRMFSEATMEQLVRKLAANIK